MPEIAITADGLGKAYRLGLRTERADTLVGTIGNMAKAPLRNFRRLRRLDTFSDSSDSADVLWALRDVSFAIREGEVVGFLGGNGAGKSTLLKILSRITEPTEGRATIRGRVSSLLEVGTGFHNELTGRQNVYMNGTILGMKRREIDRKFEEIVDFAGVERFLDTPVKRYSSGMKVRLAFSVAAHLDPEVLIIDEVLAVGDAEFQRKCLGKMQDVAGSGRTVLFVSHNMGAIQALCSRAIALKAGRIVEDGETADVVRNYLASKTVQDYIGFAADNPHRRTPGSVVFTGGRILNADGEPVSSLIAGEPATFEFEYDNPDGATALEPGIVIRNSESIAVFRLDPRYCGTEFAFGPRGTLRCTLPRLALPFGEYRVGLVMRVRDELSDNIENAMVFSVESSSFFPTALMPRRRISTALTDQVWSDATSAGPHAAAPHEQPGHDAPPHDAPQHDEPRLRVISGG